MENTSEKGHWYTLEGKPLYTLVGKKWERKKYKPKRCS